MTIVEACFVSSYEDKGLEAEEGMLKQPVIAMTSTPRAFCVRCICCSRRYCWFCSLLTLLLIL